MSGWELLDWWGYVTLPGGQRADTHALHDRIATHGLTEIRMWGGNFSLIARKPADGTLALIVDACATVPLHWSSRPVFAHPDVEVVRDQLDTVTINREFVERALLPGRIPTDETPFRGVHAVPPGCMVFLRPDGRHRSWHYFRPASLRPHAMSPERAVDLMSRAVQIAVADAVHDQVPAVHLSGGLDSGVVTALAQKVAPVVGAYTWIGPDCGEEYTPVALTAEALALDPVLTHYGDPVSRWLQDADPLLYPSWGMLFYDSATLPLAVRAGATTILSGWGGDDFASAGRNRPEVFLTTGQWRELLAHARAKAHTSDISTARALGLHRIGRRKRGEYRFPRRPSHLLDYRQGYISWRTTTWWKAGQRFGISYRYPLLDPRVVRLACQLPASYFARHGITRWGFRHIAAPLLPHEVAFRAVKVEPARVQRLRESSFQSDEIDRAHRWYPELDAVYQQWREHSQRRRARPRERPAVDLGI